VLTLVKRGARPNEESPRGLTPLLTMLIAEAQTEQIEALLKLKADINYVNRHGMTPLMLACRMKDTKLVHVLMRAEANVYTHAGSAGGGKGKRTAAHWCALHGSEEECRVLADYVKDSGGDSLRMQRFLDAQSDDGETALMLAAKRRQGAMCVTLIQMGANPSLRNRAGKNACFMAKEMGWREIGEWLEKKVGAGVANMQTYSDVQYDRKLRFGTMKMREHLEVFIKTYLQMVTASLGLAMVPIGPVSVSKHQTAEYGERAQRSLQDFVDAHQLNFHRRDKHDREVTPQNEGPTPAPLSQKSRASLPHRAPSPPRGGMSRCRWTWTTRSLPKKPRARPNSTPPLRATTRGGGAPPGTATPPPARRPWAR